MNGKIQHFGVWIKKSEKNRISRENYAVIDKNSSLWTPRTKFWYETDEARRKYYEDEECKIYNDSYCEERQEKCLINFDKSMEFFNRIPKDEFEDVLQSLLSYNKKIRQVFDLNECKGRTGIYILVLDDYKQIYIGQTKDIKNRVMTHWRKSIAFDRLLFGGVNDSVLSIDSFGALDTTRIFILETDKLDYYEVKLQKKVPLCFKLNRISGGVPIDNLDLMTKAWDRNSRNLSIFHNEEFAEKYEEEMDVTYFESQAYCELQELSKGDIICLERTERGKKLPNKCFGEVIRVTKTRLFMYKYCENILGNCCYSSKFKNKNLIPEEIRVKKTMIFSKVNMVEKKEIRTFWRSKKFPHLEA